MQKKEFNRTIIDDYEYDENDCLFCYGKGKGSRWVGLQYDTLCMTCIYSNISNITPSVIKIVYHRLIGSHMCELCDLKTECSQVSICDTCFDKYINLDQDLLE